MKTFHLPAKLFILALLFVLPVVSTESSGASGVARKFVGTWRLVSVVGGNLEVAAARGAHPTGLLYYDALGNMAVQIMPDRARAKFAGVLPTPAEAKEAVSGYAAYFGTYTVDERAGTVTHHRRGNINPGGIDDGVRHFEFAPGDLLILSFDLPAPSPPEKLTWERLK